MTEVRYRGTKVVTISPDYADNTKFAEWLPAQAGTDAALAMAMGQVILKVLGRQQGTYRRASSRMRRTPWSWRPAEGWSTTTPAP